MFRLYLGETLPDNIREVPYNVDWNARVTMENDQMAFSVDIHGSAEIEGLPAKTFDAKIVDNPSPPDIKSMDKFFTQPIESDLKVVTHI